MRKALLLVASMIVATVVVPFPASAVGPVATFSFNPTPIAPDSTLLPGQVKSVVLTVTGGSSATLTFSQAPGGGSASVNGTPLTASAQNFPTDANGQLTITYTAPTVLPTSGVDEINAVGPFPNTGAADWYFFGSAANFYFAEGYIGSGFTSDLALFMPSHSGIAEIRYFLPKATTRTVYVQLTGGKVSLWQVIADVPNGEFSALVELPYPGVVERLTYFNNGTWKGSTDIVGSPAPATQWNFAEGSTLAPYSEYLTLQNPNNSAVVVDLQYMLDNGSHPIKTLTLPATSRTTVVVFQGDLSNNPACSPGFGGNCGVGRAYTAVSILAQSRTLPIVAERPFYVNNYSFGSGPIRDGHVAFGATSAAAHWFFAEGNTLVGWNEYLTIENPNVVPVTVTIIYSINAATQPTKTLTLNPLSRATVPVFQGDTNAATCTPQGGGDCGVGRGYLQVGAEVTASGGPIVVERPMYMVQNFGSGTVAGAHDGVGLLNPGQLYGFAYASTLDGDNDYLTILNPSSGTASANVTLTYYTPGSQVTRTFTVPVGSRHTVVMSQTNNPVDHQADGLGIVGLDNIGIVLSSDQPVLVEKPTYSSNVVFYNQGSYYGGTYGASDTGAYAPPNGF